MKNIFNLVFFLLLIITTDFECFASEENPFYRKSFALVVGINDYSAAGSKWNSLDYAKGDAKAVSKMLKSLGFDVIELYDKDATRANIIDGLQTNIADQIGEEDRVIFFFSGHGDTRARSGEDYGYIIPYDASKGYSSYIAVDEIAKCSRMLSKCKHQLFIIDACYGGLLGNTKDKITLEQGRYPSYLIESTSRVAKHILTAGGKDQKVSDFGPDGHSLFTNALLAAIYEGKADSYRDGFITFLELANYILAAASNDRQTPGFDEFDGHEQGVFVFKSPKQQEVEVALTKDEAIWINKFKGKKDPVIDFFEIAPLSVIKGNRIKMQWKARNGNCEITGIDKEIGLSGSISFEPKKTQTFKLICTGNKKEAISSITIDVTQPVKIMKFTSNKEIISPDHFVDLIWKTENAQKCIIKPNIGTVDKSGSLSVKVSDTTKFELECDGETGAVSKWISIFVEKPSVSIESFSVNEKMPDRGEIVQLSWRAYNADYCSINEGIGRVNSAGIKSLTVDERVTYILSCYQGKNVMNREVTVVPQDRVKILSFKASRYSIREGRKVKLKWKTENADNCEINEGVGKVDTNDYINQEPIEDTTYTLTCTGIGGPVSEEIDIKVKQRSIVSDNELFMKLPSGTGTIPCGCHGFVQFGSERVNIECASGFEIALPCQGYCHMGGLPWGARCK